MATGWGGGSQWPVECLDIIENRVLTWRIIPASKWLGSPPFTSHEYSPFARGPTTLLFLDLRSPYYITTKNQFLGADPPSILAEWEGGTGGGEEENSPARRNDSHR